MRGPSLWPARRPPESSPCPPRLWMGVACDWPTARQPAGGTDFLKSLREPLRHEPGAAGLRAAQGATLRPIGRGGTARGAQLGSGGDAPADRADARDSKCGSHGAAPGARGASPRARGLLSRRSAARCLHLEAPDRAATHAGAQGRRWQLHFWIVRIGSLKRRRYTYDGEYDVTRYYCIRIRRWMRDTFHFVLTVKHLPKGLKW